MDRDRIAESVARHAQISFSRSGGPGGQNVNKVNTKVTLAMPFELIDGLSPREMEAAARRLAARTRESADTPGRRVLLVRVQDTRNQGLNREIALERMVSLIADAARLSAARIPTHMGAARRRRNLDSKRAHGQIKQARRTPSPE